MAIKMFNSLNTLSQDTSMIMMPPWVNLWLLLAMSTSFGLHFVILNVPLLGYILQYVYLVMFPSDVIGSISLISFTEQITR
uniref:Uncharacterized protein n=1 Tax=Aegilops tauschii subsp. strangulata TaxID=200361 RepID=A0A452Z636_AEGTS